MSEDAQASEFASLLAPDDALLAQVAKYSSAGIVITDEDERVLYVNAAFERISGYTLHEMRGKRPGPSLQGPSTDEAARAILRYAIAERVPVKTEIVNYHKNGNPYWMEISLVHILGERAGMGRFIAIEQDVSDKREAMSRLQSAEKELNSVFESITEHAVLLLDARGYIQRLNGANASLTGWPVAALMGRPLWELKKGRGMRARFQRVLATASRGKVAGVSRLRRRDGSRVWCRWSIAPLHGVDGGLDGYVMVSHDVTAERIAARRREVARQQAEDLAKSKGTFLATMSHEIRTPLNGVLGLARLLLDETLNDNQRRLATTLLASAESLLTVVNDVLDFSKLEAGKMSLSPAPVAISEIVRGVVSILEVGARSKGLRLTATIADDVPPYVMADAGRMRQVLLNLVGNAIKFTDHGSVSLDLQIIAPGTPDARLKFAVRDTGIGIAPEDQERLFRNFEQVDDSSARRQKGTGLGLAISQQISNLMDGHISVASVAGEGSTFTLTIPCVLAEAIPLTSVPVKPTRRFRGARVLLVDDNPVNQLVGKLMLEREGCFVELASDGYECLRMVAEAHWDLVLMDGSMPGLDGYEATRRLRANTPANTRVPVIACSASAFPEDRRKALDCGMDDVLPKPISPESLGEILARWLPEQEQLAAVEESTLTRMPRLVRATLIEESRLEVLRRLDKTGAAADAITDSFVAAGPGRMQALRDALGRGDRDAMERSAHSLRGSAAQLGAVAVEEAARSVEEASQVADDLALYPMLTGLEQALNETLVALKLLRAA